MPLVGIQRRAWTATTPPPAFSAADANSFEIVSKIELAIRINPLFLILRTGSTKRKEGTSAEWLGTYQKARHGKRKLIIVKGIYAEIITFTNQAPASVLSVSRK